MGLSADMGWFADEHVRVCVGNGSFSSNVEIGRNKVSRLSRGIDF